MSGLNFAGEFSLKDKRLETNTKSNLTTLCCECTVSSRSGDFLTTFWEGETCRLPCRNYNCVEKYVLGKPFLPPFNFSLQNRLLKTNSDRSNILSFIPRSKTYKHTSQEKVKTCSIIE